MKMLKMRGFAVAALVMMLTNVMYGQSRPSLLNRRNRRPILLDQRQIAKFPPLVPLLPFAEAVVKAKAGDGAGLYAVALHYAKGDEIQHDDIRARTYLKVAADAGYGNAVLMNTIVLEQMMDTNMYTNEAGQTRSVLRRFEIRGGNENIELKPNTDKYTQGIDINQFADYNCCGQLSHRERVCNIERRIMSVTNVDDVAVIRKGYERAALLGVTAATNELARFEARLAVLEMQRKIREIFEGQRQRLQRQFPVQKIISPGSVRGASSLTERLQKQFPMQKIIAQNEELAKELDGTITNSVLMALIKNGNKAEQAERETREQEERQRAAEERAQQREALRQVQEQLRRQREAEEKKRQEQTRL